MGLGKTVQVIALLALLHENGDIGPHLIVVPATLISNWERELASWCPNLEVSTYYGLEKERYEMRQEYLSEGYSFNVMLTTYTVCQRKGDKHFLSKLPWTYVILDEAQNIKNAVSKRFTSLVKIPSKRRLLLTGTPLQNNLKELWTLLQFLMPTLFEGPRDDLFKLLSLKSQSEKNTQRIKSILAPFMLRRLKTQVIKHLPKKVESIKPVKMAAVQESLYTSIMQKSRTAWADSRITLST
ncbi:snf2 family dna-dependent atpase [Pelomyxa schiedti]|nr:snf2 family dna-dependent atpase [Pelomyxa schiedti]